MPSLRRFRIKYSLCNYTYATSEDILAVLAMIRKEGYSMTSIQEIKNETSKHC